jgi:8-oxo-dGTP pyrophosphatase MutT (NUDIX family)
MAFLFVLAVVHKDERFLLVQEAKADRGTWFLPAGGVLPGESLTEAVVREVREEAGIDAIPCALLWMEDETFILDDGTTWAGRWRFFIRAEPSNPGQSPGPTDDSLDAGWFTLAEMTALPLRSPRDVLMACQAVADGAPELPIETGYLRQAPP